MLNFILGDNKGQSGLSGHLPSIAVCGVALAGDAAHAFPPDLAQVRKTIKNRYNENKNEAKYQSRRNQVTWCNLKHRTIIFCFDISAHIRG